MKKSLCKGAVLLKEKLKKRGLSAEFSRVSGIADRTIASWKSGARRPEARERALLSEVFSIPESAWLTPVDRAHIKSVSEGWREVAAS